MRRTLGIALLAWTVAASTRAQTDPFLGAWRSGTPITITGVLSVLSVDDVADADVQYWIRDASGQSFRIRSAQTLHGRSGARVTLSGRLQGGEVYLSTEQAVAVNQITPSSALVASGDQQILVIVANFRDRSVSCTVPAIRDLMFTDLRDRSVDDLYREMSFGRISLSGTVVGPYDLSASATDPCNLDGWAAAASMAAAADANASDYARTVYVLPSSACPAAGTADFNTTPSRAWVFTCDLPDVYAHELGHNLGMQHASTPDDEYGDVGDVMSMGYGMLRQVGSPHKVQMGWLQPSGAPEISQDGVYDVAALELDPATASMPQALKVFKADTNDFYYVSFRVGMGFDSSLTCCPYLNRLSVHRWAGGTNKTYLLAALLDGETFTDPVTGFRVTQIAHGPTSATAQIHIGTPPPITTTCDPVGPDMGVEPINQSGRPGASLSYSLTLVNRDAAECGPTTFGVSITCVADAHQSCQP